MKNNPTLTFLTVNINCANVTHVVVKPRDKFYIYAYWTIRPLTDVKQL